MQRGYCGIGLDNVKDPLNVGSVLRAIGNFDASFLAISGNRFNNYKNQRTDTMKHYKHVPLFKVEDLKNMIPFKCTPVAVDLIDDAIPLHEYKHPESAFYIFGAEDQTLGESILSYCHDVVYIPTNRCMNLAATVNVILYDRMAKQLLNNKET